MNDPQDNRKNQYLVHHQGQVQGPFDIDFIEAMVMAGVYPPTVKVRAPEASAWGSLAQLTGLPAPRTTASQSSSADSGRTTEAARTVTLAPTTQLTDSNGSGRAKKNADPMTVFGWVVGAGGLLFLLWLFVSVTSSHQKAPSYRPPGNTASSNAQPTSAYSPSAQRPSPRPSSPARQVAPTPYSTPNPVLPVDDSVLYRDAFGRTYRVPHADYNRLVAMKTALHPKKTVMDQREAEFKSEQRQVEAARNTLDRTNEYEVDAFNSKIRRLNASNDRLQTLVGDYNRDVDAFNAELARVGTPSY